MAFFDVAHVRARPAVGYCRLNRGYLEGSVAIGAHRPPCRGWRGGWRGKDEGEEEDAHRQQREQKDYRTESTDG